LVQRICLLIALATLAGCAVSPYDEGKSVADVPANVHAICLKQFYVTSGAPYVDGEPPGDPSPSESNLEVLSIAKGDVIADLTAAGYKLVDDPHGSCDLRLKVSTYYQPERWPVIQRSIFVIMIVYGSDDVRLFRAAGVRFNNFGLIGAVAGPSRDDMVSATARDAVDNLLAELHKGTKKNTPVSRLRSSIAWR
jgi:hypothetical protein